MDAAQNAVIGDSQYARLVCNEGSVQNYPGVVERVIDAENFADFVPNPGELREHLVDLVDGIGRCSLRLHLTSFADACIARPKPVSTAVIVPCYNCSDYVAETLTSICAQDIENLQILIVDDGSTDSTRDTVLEFMSACSGNQYIAFLEAPHTGNPAISRNVGLFNLVSDNTDYVAFMDSDDLYATAGALTSLQEALVASPEAICAYGDYDWISANGEPLKGPQGLTETLFSRKTRWRSDRVLSWQNLATGRIGVFHLQCLMVKVGAPFIPYRPQGEDEEFFASLFRKSSELTDGELTRVLQIPELVAHYRRHPDSITSNAKKIEPLKNLKAYTGNPTSNLPSFYDFAAVPETYRKPRFLSEWLLRRAAREALRRVRRGNQGVVEAIRTIVKTPGVRKRDFVFFPFKLLYFQILN